VGKQKVTDTGPLTKKRMETVDEETGQAKESPRQSIMYMSDDGEVIAVRVGDYKFHLAQQRANTMRLWSETFVKLRMPYIMNLRRDPFDGPSSTRIPTWTGWSTMCRSCI